MDLELLRQRIHSRILQHDVRDQVKTLVGSQVTSTDKVIETLKHQGLIENLMNEINFGTESASKIKSKLSSEDIFENLRLRSLKEKMEKRK